MWKKCLLENHELCGKIFLKEKLRRKCGILPQTNI